MTRLSDNLLRRILTGTGRVYGHEARAMAEEILQARAAAAPATASQCYGLGSHAPTCRCKLTGYVILKP